MLATSTLPIDPPSGEWEYLLPKTIRRNALYRRVSGDDQERGSSLSDQFDAFVTRVGQDGGVFKEEHIFTDVRSGDGKYWRDREGIQALLAAAKRHELDFVYVAALDRFGRDYAVQEFLIQELKYYGVTLISMKKDEQTEGRNDPSSVLARTFFGMMAQEELKRIKDRTHLGIRGRVTKKVRSWLDEDPCTATIGLIKKWNGMDSSSPFPRHVMSSTSQKPRLYATSLILP